VGDGYNLLLVSPRDATPVARYAFDVAARAHER